MPPPRIPSDPSAAIDDLISIRDWLRYGVSRFEAARIVFGHGTATALDEAAFLILSALDLPVDRLEPWLDARLVRDERMRVLELIERRIATRKPAPYLVGAAYIGGHRFFVDERVIVPRSFIGELLVRDGLAAVAPSRVMRILDLCTGSGCLAILAALRYPQAEVDATDIAEGALAVASRNVVDYGLEDRVRLLRSDLFGALGDARYDLVISNPPYVTAAAVAAFPPEYRAEPQLAHLGGEDGLDLVRRILDEAPARLTPDGALVVEIGQARPALETAYPDLPFLWLDTETSEGEVFALRASDLAAPPPHGVMAAVASPAAGKRRRRA
jgi:ribosomal protein L3 glutamine methyltransferase